MSYKIAIFWQSVRPDRKNRILKMVLKNYIVFWVTVPPLDIKKIALKRSDFFGFLHIMTQRILALCTTEKSLFKWRVKMLFEIYYIRILTTSYFEKWSLCLPSKISCFDEQSVRPIWRRSLWKPPQQESKLKYDLLKIYATGIKYFVALWRYIFLKRLDTLHCLDFVNSAYIYYI